MAQATLELIINGSVGSGFSSMMSQVKGAIADFKNETQNSYDAFGAKIDVLKGKATNFQADLAKGRELLKKDIKDGLLPFGAVIAGLTLSAKAAIEFESSFAEIKKVVDGTDEEFQNLAGNLDLITQKLPVSRLELNAITAEAGKLGIALKDLPKFAETVAGGKIIFGMSADEVGKAFATLSAVYGLSMTELEDTRDVINEVSKLGVVPEQIFDATQRIGGQAVNFGLTAEQATALSAAMLKLGNTPEVAGTALKTLMRELQNAEKGSAKFKNALEEIGLSAEDVKEMLKEPEKGLMQFLETLERVPRENRTGILTDLFGKQQQSAIAQLVNGLGEYRRAIELSQNAAGSAQKEIDAQLATTQSNLKLFKNAVEGISQAIGKNLLPAITGILECLTPVIQVVGTFLGQYPKVTTGLLLLTGGLIAGKVAASTFFLGLNYLVTAGTMLWKVALVGANVFKVFLVPAIKLVGTAIAFVGRLLLLNPIGLLITGIATAAFLIYKYWEPIKKFFSGLWDTIKSVLSGLYEKMVSFGSHLIEGLIEGLKKSTGALWQAVKDAGSAVKDAFKSVLGINSPSKVFQGFGENIGQGLILGVNATKGAANRAMSELANPRLKTGGAGFAGGSGAAMRITYSPTINLAGAAENVKREVSDALKNSQVEFEKMFKRMVTQNERRALVW